MSPISARNYITPLFALEPLDDLSFHHREYPGLAAGTEDCAFQGVDLVFFESVMRGIREPGRRIGSAYRRKHDGRAMKVVPEPRYGRQRQDIMAD
jgi:hypothetical protein